jgi:hypothetical protein
VFLLIVYAHRTAHEDKVGGIRAGDFAGFVKVNIFERNAMLSKDLFEKAKGLGWFVLEYGNFHDPYNV